MFICLIFDLYRKPILHCWEDIDAFHLLDDNIVDIILKMVITCMHVHDHGMHVCNVMLIAIVHIMHDCIYYYRNLLVLMLAVDQITL